jgi:hypothetical protein
MVEGLRQRHADDHELLEQGMVLVDALARSYVGPRVPRKRKPR